MKRFFRLSLYAFLLFFSVLLIRTLMVESRQVDYPAVQPIEVSPDAVGHLSQAIRIPTISHDDPTQFDSTAFRNYIDFLAATYPMVHSQLDRRYFNDFSVLYHWPGTNDELDPVLLMSHYDVVPVEQATLAGWKHQPYSGELVQDTIWGRGAIDDKMAGIAILETFEQLLEAGYQPQRGIYLSLGHDEERGGFLGAAAVADYLEEQEVRLDYVLDEGGAITRDIIPLVNKEVALIGIAEKGFLNLQLSASMSGGHSSIPLSTNAIDVLSSGLSRLRSNPFPARISDPVKLFMEHLGPEASFPMKFALTNSDILGPVLLKGLAQIPQGKANIRTTVVPTIFASGIKGNVIPKVASATVNLRILPGESIQSAIQYVRETVGDQRIRIEAESGAAEPSQVSDIHSRPYEMLYRTTREVFPDVAVVPNLLVGGTDSRYFAHLTDHIFRFRPMRMGLDNVQSFHGLNERMPVADLEDAIRFFHRLITNSTSGSLPIAG